MTVCEGMGSQLLSDLQTGDLNECGYTACGIYFVVFGLGECTRSLSLHCILIATIFA